MSPSWNCELHRIYGSHGADRSSRGQTQTFKPGHTPTLYTGYMATLEVSEANIPIYTILRRKRTLSYREGNGTPLQYSCLESPMDGGAWWAAVHGVTKSRTRLSEFTLTFHFHALEKEMATHSSVLAWRIPGTGEPGGLPSMGSHRVGHD